MCARISSRAAAQSRSPSIEERYASRTSYLSRARGSADALVGFRYLLAEDVEGVMRRAADHWDFLKKGPDGAVSSR
jgi:hypothetical protein